MKISIICVYNKKAILDQQLLKSLQDQDINFEFVGVDNTDNRLKSAAEALNSGVRNSNGEILIFSHQDIFFKGTDSLRNLVEAIECLEVGSIVGTQGVREKGNKYYSNLTCGEELNPDNLNDFNLELIQVDCVDEGLFGMKKETWNKYNLNEKMCDNWHLYAVDACLNTRKNGNKVFVMPIQMHHFSKGKITINYMLNLRRMCQAYRSDFKYIWTTCYKVYTNPMYIDMLILVWVLNRKIRNKSLY